MANLDQKRRVESRLADVLDRTAELELLELVAGDDELRDLRYKAEQLRLLLTHAADDFVLEPGHADAAAKDTGGNAGPATDTGSKDSADASPQDPDDAVGSTIHSSKRLKAEAPSSAAVKTGSIPGHVVVMISLGIAAVIGAMALWLAPGGKKTEQLAEGGSLVHAKIAQIERLSDGALIEVCEGPTGSCHPAEPQERIGPGQLVRSNHRGRARLTLEDGSTIGLERATSLELASGELGGLKLHTGSVILDVSPVDARRFGVGTKSGRVEFSQIKCAISVDVDRSSIEVTRGRASLVDLDGRKSEVYAGETGTLQAGRSPNVQYTRKLGNAVAEAESIGEQPQDSEASRGLGELRAKKPGETNERANAVRLTRHHVRARIVGAMARTEIDEVFTNDTNDVLEGIFRFPLPADAQIERLALEVDGKLVDGAFADRERAAAIWRGSIVQAAPQLRSQIRDEIVWVPGPWRDPALLEWQRGNRFELRIYPIPKQGSRRIVLSYTQVVPGDSARRQYSYPLPKHSSDARTVEDFSLDLELRGFDAARRPSIVGYEAKLSKDSEEITRVRIDEQRFQPRGDLLVDYGIPHAEKELIAWASQPAASEEPYFAMLLRPKLPAPAKRGSNAYAIVVDTSRSMFGESLRRASALTAKMVRELSSEDRVTVLACDSECRTWPEGTIGGGKVAAENAQRWLGFQTADGASDLTRAVEAASESLQASGDRVRHVVYVGDGTPTAGPTRPATIASDVRRIIGQAPIDITAVAVGADSDLESLRALARAAQGVVVPYAPGTSVSHAAYAALAATFGTRLSKVVLELPSAMTSVAPERFDTVAAGEELLIVGRMRPSQLKGDVILRGKVQGSPFEQRYPIDLRAISGERHAFVPRLYAASRISDLERRGDEASKHEAIELSRRFSVASRYTSLLVLESPAMFDAFGLDNRRSAQIWTGEFEDSATGSDAQGEEPSEIVSQELAGAGLGVGRQPLQRSSSQSTPAYRMQESAAAPAAAAKPAAPVPMGAAPAPMKEDVATKKTRAPQLSTRGDAAIAVDDWSEPPRPRRPMIPMRRIWERKGEVLVGVSRPSNASPEKVTAAEREMDANPDRRSATKKLFDVYARAGEIERARELAERWSERDPLDVEALVARADVAARSGDRPSAIRILGSVVDVRPSDVGAQQRLSRLWRWQAQPKSACRFATALAEFRPTDEKALAEALRCLQEIGHVEVARELKATVAERVLRAAERLLEQPRPADSLSGDLRVTATWRGGEGVDLDLSVIDPDAHRVSWLGAPTRAVITATNVVSTNEEGLALRGGKPGEYLLEVSRGSGVGRVEGTVTVSLAGTLRQIPFALESNRTALAVLRITTVPRLVPLYR